MRDAPQADFDGVVRAVEQRYAGCGRGVRRYVGSKLRRDPVHRDLLDLAARETFGSVIDIGAGRGQLGLALLVAGRADSVLALDMAEAHLAQARAAGGGLAVTTRVQDFADDQAFAPADTVLLIDVLYQLAPAAQERLLRNAAVAARRRVLIRTLDPERGLRSALTIGFERLTLGRSPHSGRHVAPPPVAQLMDLLGAEGFAASVAPCWRGTPFANVLVTGRRSLTCW